MARVAFGMFDWVDRGQRPLHQLYAERLQLIEQADAAGFYSYHLAEHHATPLGMAPSPALFLSAAAQRTRSLRLGPLGYLLPLYHPLRLCEEVCMLDQLSAGRLDLGVGRGISPYELGCFGVDAEESRSIFHEAMAVLVAALTSTRLDFQGRHFKFHDVPIELDPFQRPYPPLWYPTRNPESVVYAGEQGYNVVTLGLPEMVRQLVDQYWTAWESNQHDTGRLNYHVPEPKVGLMRQIYVADTGAAAELISQEAHSDWFNSITSLWHQFGDHSLDQRFNWQASVAEGAVIFGSPGQVKDQLAQLLEITGCNYVALAFAWGTLSLEQSQDSLRLFTEQVMPELAGQIVAGH